jgi:hypothetical protein
MEENHKIEEIGVGSSIQSRNHQSMPLQELRIRNNEYTLMNTEEDT